jgi:tetratricopeptide (TPR) repeat protein
MDLLNFYRKLTNQYNIGIWFEKKWVYEVDGMVTECRDDEDEIGVLTEALREYESNNGIIVEKYFKDAIAFQIKEDFDAALSNYLYIVEMTNGYYKFADDDDILTEALFAISDCYIAKDDFNNAYKYILEAESHHDRFMLRCKHFEKAKLFLNFAIRELMKCDNSDNKFITEDFDFLKDK